MTKLANGLVVASMENNSPVFRVAAVVQAGAKYEPYESRGVTSLLRVFSNLVNLFSSRLSSAIEMFTPLSILEHEIRQSIGSNEEFGTSRSELQVKDSVSPRE